MIKHWITKGFYDFEGNTELLKKLELFIKNTMVPAMGTGGLNPAHSLLQQLEKKVYCFEPQIINANQLLCAADFVRCD